MKPRSTEVGILVRPKALDRKALDMSATTRARARNVRGSSGEVARHHEPELGFIKKLLPLIVAMSLVASMFPAPALAGVDGADGPRTPPMSRKRRALNPPARMSLRSRRTLLTQPAQRPRAATPTLRNRTARARSPQRSSRARIRPPLRRPPRLSRHPHPTRMTSECRPRPSR